MAIGRSRADIEVRLVERNLPNFERLKTGDAALIVDYLPEVPDWVATVPLAQCHFFAVLPREHEGAGDRGAGECRPDEGPFGHEPRVNIVSLVRNGWAGRR